MTLVLDCSVTLAWLFEDEQTPAVLEILTRVEQRGAWVPSLWCLEVANSLQMALRRGRIGAVRRDDCLDGLGKLAITIDARTQSTAWHSTLSLADDHRLTMYDAAYLDLSRREGLPLATLDRQLRVAAGAIGVPVLPPQV